MQIFDTERLSVRQFSLDDADFILELLNEPGYIQNISDRNIRCLDDARRYLESGPIASYAANGFGLFRVALKDSDTPIGMAGLIRRTQLEDVDIGYALLERYWGQGYATEVASAMLQYGYEVLKLPRIIAIIAPDNAASAHVLEKIGLRSVGIINLPDLGGESRLFVPAGKEDQG
jgi:RimJ/RimL family protein N-acetyltransferase